MVVVTLTGGLGNQLFQYTIGKQLAIKNETTLKLYIANLGVEDGRSYKLNHYNIDEVLATESEVEKLIGEYYSSSLYAKIYRKIDSYRPKYKRKYYVEDENWRFEPEVMKVSSNVLLEGFWQHHKYYEKLDATILGELTLKKEETFTVKSLKDIEKDSTSVSLHIRRGDYVSDLNNASYFGVMPLHYYQKAVEHVNSQIKNPNFYIFSDDLDWAKDNLKMHVPMTFVDVEGGKKDYLELDAMSHCRHNIIANSTFSWWAAFLNKNPDKIVIAPEKWVVSEEMNKGIHIQFPSWIKL
ncbi:alpha-1,2-fucosyltransferase [Pontibacter diazotrophicus]|uniref:Alpha-1,2-fucosyltransferase n=1 Tax=Pontibacter diazotrophicus TaxID=1400979 RepID=A0A3D8LH89_9BACT|nr:alpha-1,2-fucosyltransferase [Pontibacter diazotrophicus]RDV16706.1 alpha-1,2-fucosyltransferase [Pontibacter diazotrophicus]